MPVVGGRCRSRGVYICELSRRLQEGVDGTQLGQDVQTEGANLTSAACSVCQWVFTLTKMNWFKPMA